MKYKEKYRAGMMFKSKRNPWADLVISCAYYDRLAESSVEFNNLSCICWHRINWEAFDKYVCIRKGYNYMPEQNGRMDFRDKTTFPFPSFGEAKSNSMDLYIKKYELEFAGMCEDEVIVYHDDNGLYHSELSIK